MGYNTNRTTVANTTVRFFMERHQAIPVANRLTEGTSEQHHAVSAYIDVGQKSPDGTSSVSWFHAGYLIENVVKKTYMDTDGILPEAVIKALRIRR